VPTRVVVVADHTIIRSGRQSLAFLCGLEEVDTLIVDAGISAEGRELLKDRGVRLLVAGESEEFR